MRSKDEMASLGSVLLEWELITPTQLEKAQKDMETLQGDALLGRLLVASDACSTEDVETALSALVSLKAVGKTGKAMAVAELALERRRRDNGARREHLMAQAERIERTITRDDYPAIIPMMAKPSE